METPIQASIVIAVSDETDSLRETIRILQSLPVRSSIHEILYAVGKITTPESMAACEALRSEASFPSQIIRQKKPGPGGAYQDAFEVATGTHAIMLAGDLETDPRDVEGLIRKAGEFPDAVICTTRWQGDFGKGYNPVKWAANFVFQQIFRILYRTPLTDMTFGYRLYPLPLLKKIRWEEYFHPFFLESIIKPLKLGVKAVEIPTSWKPRSEGVSHNSFFKNFLYFKIGFRVLMMDRKDLLTNP